ncbi:MAG: dephospho-CoA kinase [Planctomycetota bacterium]
MFRVASARPPVIGLVGGVGSGKSSLVSGLTDFAVQVIDADRIGHQQLRQPAIRAALVEHFGKNILGPDGDIHRPALAAVVFGDSPAQQLALETLNRIVHPGIRTEILRQLSLAPRTLDAVFLDAALLLESGLASLCDLLIYIDTPEELRCQRATASRGWSHKELQRRERSQWPLERKRAACHHTIDNSGSLADSSSQLRLILQQFPAHTITSTPAP